MSIKPFKCLPLALLVLGCASPGAFAQPAAGIGEKLHAEALASFNQARFPEAYGRFSGLADAGHAPAAAMALWMYLNGTSVFGKDWDSSPQQLAAWAKLAGQPVPVMVGRTYPQPATVVARQGR
jgi:hypothetical protein